MQTAVFSVSAAANNKNISEITDVLESFSIYLQADEMDYHDDYLTRGTLAMILSAFKGNKRTEELKDFRGTSLYSDVTSGTKGAYEIMYMSDAGCLSGYTDGTFRPEGKVKYIEALKSIVALLGYDNFARQAGGWPTGYEKMAAELGLVNGIGISYDDNITKGDFTKLIWNALDTEVLKINNDNSYEHGQILLNELGFYELSGIFTATDKTALFGYDESSTDTVRIGDTMLSTEGKYEGYLGKFVTAYYMYDKKYDEGVLLNVLVEESKNEIEVVEAYNISDKTTTSHFVYFDGNKEKSTPITSNTSVIFNGRRLTYFNLEHLVPKNGTVTLVNAQGGSDFETIIIESYVDYFVTSVYNNGTVLSIAEGNGKPPVTLELEYKDDNVLVQYGDKVLDVTDLKQNMLISVSGDKMEKDSTSGMMVVSDKSENYKILISSKAEAGEITTIDGSEFVINGNKYRVSKAIDLTRNYIEIGKYGVVYINALGEAAKIKYLTSGEKVTYYSEDLVLETASLTDGESYGFIQQVLVNTDDEKVTARIFLQTGEFKMYEITNRTKLDGKTYKDELDTKFLQALKNASNEFRTYTSISETNKSGYEQIVRYKADGEGNLTSIDTVARNYEDDLMEEDCFSFDLCIEKQAGHEYIYSLAGTIMGRVAKADSMVTFMIPDDLSQRDNYAMYNLTADHYDLTKMYFFDMDDFKTAKVCFIQDTFVDTLQTKDMTNMMVVSGKSTILNAEQEVVDAIEGFVVSTGMSTTLELSDDVLEETVAKIENGDIIRWIPDAYGKAKLVEISVTYDGEGTYLNDETPYTNYYAGGRSTFGTVENIDSTRILINYSDGTCEVSRLADVSQVFVVDVNNGTVEKGSLSLIKSIQGFGEENASKVFTKQSYARPNTIIIYNK